MFSFSNISLSVTSFHSMLDSEKIITCNLIINEYMHLHLFWWPDIKALTLLHMPTLSALKRENDILSHYN